MVVAYEVGKQGLKTCSKLFKNVFDRVQLPSFDNKIQIFSDGNDDYKTTIPKYYAENCVDYGQVIKIREGGKVRDFLLFSEADKHSKLSCLVTIKSLLYNK